MKKLVVVFVLFFIVMGGVSLFAQERLTVNLSTLPFTRNAEPLTARWGDVLIRFPAWPANVDWTRFNRVIIRAKYFNAEGNEIRQQDDHVMVTLIYNPEGDIRGPEMGPGPNTPLKAFNVGGGSSTVHTDRGAPIRLERAPGAILFQNANANVRFIEVTEITFFRR
jgi:hypothetical protein